MRVLVYGLMALALSLAGVLMSVHHSGGEEHAVRHASSQSVPAHSADHYETVAMTDAHADEVADPCVTCGHDDSSMLLIACAFMAVLISLTALVHPARVFAPARTDQVRPFRARPPDESGVSGGVNLDQLCVSRR